MKVLLIQAHPRSDSFCAALAASYVEGARQTGVELAVIELSELDFDFQLQMPSPEMQSLEPDLEKAKRLIEWADHLVFVYPNWWGTMPAQLKGFLDRILIPGWAFRFHSGHAHWDKLLKGRTAELITTMDTPPWVHRLFNRRPGYNAMRHATLGFCGIRIVRETVCGPIVSSNIDKRRVWLRKVFQRGLNLRYGVFSRAQRWADLLIAWLKSLRLQFYFMTLVTYTLGALLAPQFSAAKYGLGYLLLFLLEAATVWINEVQDYETDRRNRAYGPFTGGSRVLVNKELSPEKLNRAAAIAIALGAAGGLLLLSSLPAPIFTAIPLALFAILALGYTLPPLRLAYRGIGELDVAFTHSFAVLLCGYVFQGGEWLAALPWLLSVPIFLSVFAAITLAGVPDIQADRQVGKRTLAVRCGPQGAAWIALFAIVGSVWATISLSQMGLAAYEWAWGFIVAHAIVAVGMLLGYIHRKPEAGRINSLLVVSLTFIMWFCLTPLYFLI